MIFTLTVSALIVMGAIFAITVSAMILFDAERNVYIELNKLSERITALETIHAAELEVKPFTSSFD